MTLTVDGKEIEVKPLTYKQSKKFASRLEEQEKSRLSRAENDPSWPGFYQVADIAADMIALSTGLDKEVVEEALPMHEVGDWLPYMQHGPETLEKKRAKALTTTTSS